MSLNTHSDTDGRTIAHGSVEVRKEHSYAEHKEVKWNVNDPQFQFNNTSKLWKCELRRSPRNEVLEDVVISWKEVNNEAVDVEKLPSFFNCVESIRVQINNREVVDMKTGIYGIRQEWRERLYNRYRNTNEQDAAWSWRTGQLALHTGALQLQPITVPAGGEVQCYASMSDLLGGVFDGLPMRRINLIEIELTFASEQRFLGNVPEVLNIQHQDITVYSRHKNMTIPSGNKPFSNHTIFHKEFEVIRIDSPSPLHVLGSGELRIDLHNLIPRRSNIERIHVFGQAGDAEAYRRLRNSFVGRLYLEKNGDFYLGTDFFYRDRRQIAYQSAKYFQRHHGGTDFPEPSTGGASYGVNSSQCFIDCTMVTKTLNATPLMETKTKASEGVDNHDNLDLIIQCNGAQRLLADETAVILVEYSRYSRINPSGQIVHIATP
jgi:hypothetical protein